MNMESVDMSTVAKYENESTVDDISARDDPNNDREDGRESDQEDDRDRKRRGYERDSRHDRRYSPYPSKDARSGASQSQRSLTRENRVYVHNLPYSVRWQDLKDHMKRAGEVAFAEVIEDDQGRSKGCGIVEFKTKEDAEKCIRDLNGSEIQGRSIRVREDRVDHEDRRPRPSRESRSSRSSSHSRDGGQLSGLMGLNMMAMMPQLSSRSSDPLAATVFVSNLDYKVTWQRLKDTFKVAGHVVRAEISEDNDKKSRGYGTVQFETPMDALNAVTMFNGQMLYDRPMAVRLDRNSPLNSVMNSNSNMSNNPMSRMASMNPLAMMQLQLATLASMGGLAGMSNMGNMSSGGGNVSDSQNMNNPFANLAGLSNMLGLGGMGSAGSQQPSNIGALSAVGPGGKSRQIFVRNLPWKLTWQDLKDKFRDAGKVLRADIMTEASGRSKGCGTVTFEEPDDAERAIQLFNGSLLDGREIDVRLDKFV